MSGYGGGVENFNVGFGKAALAFLGGARPEIVTNAGAYSKVNIDTRVYDIKAPLGKVAFWFDYAVAKGGTTQKGVTFPTAAGYAFGFTHQRLKWEGGYTQFGVQYGKGAASYFSSSLDNPTIYLKNSTDSLLRNRWSFNPIINSPLCRSRCINGLRTATQDTAPIGGYLLGQGRSTFSLNTFL